MTSQRVIRAFVAGCAVICALLAATPGVQAQTAGTFTEGFDTTALEDPGESTALWWDLGSELRLYMYRKTFIGSASSIGAAVDVAVSGEYAYAAQPGAGMVIYDLSVKTSPSAVGAVATPTSPEAIVVKGDHAFIAAGSAGLVIMDISSVGGASLIKTVSLPGLAKDLVVAGNKVYVATYSHGIHVVDINFPPAAATVGSLSGISGAWGIDVQGDRAYITDKDSGNVWVIDITDPAAMYVTGVYDTTFNPVKIDVEGDLAYVALESDGLLMLDISGSGAPTLAGSAPWITVMDVEVEGDWAYFPTSIGTFAMMDVRDPADPEHWGSEPIAGFARAVRVAGEQVFVAAATGGIEVWQIADLLEPAVVGSAVSGYQAGDIVVQGRTAYVLNDNVGMQIYDITDPAAPVLLGSLLGVPGACGIDVDGDLAALAHQSGGVMTVDVSDPANPLILDIEANLFTNSVVAQDVKIDGDILHVAGTDMSYAFYDISDPNNISSYCGLGSDPALKIAVDGDVGALARGANGVIMLDWSFSGCPSTTSILSAADARDVALDGNTLYVANGVAGVKVADITSLSSVFTLIDVATAGAAEGVRVEGDYLFVSEGISGLEVFDITDPTDPILVHQWTGTFPVAAVAVSGDYCYAASAGGGLQVLGVFQRSWDQDRNQGQSLVFASEPHDVVQMRISANQAERIDWFGSSDGGNLWAGLPADGSWANLFGIGADLKWRSLHKVVVPRQNPICTDLQIDWMYDVPVVAAVSDVPNDQGRQVSLSWHRSGFDALGSFTRITEYAVYRYVEGSLAATSGQDPAKAYPPGDWHFLMTVPADAEDSYAVVVPTLGDSTITDGQYLSTFFVRARTSTPGEYFDSTPLSGYSLDNLEPAVPTGLQFQTAAVLVWDEPVDADFKYFSVYKSDSPVLDASAVEIGHTTGTTLDVAGHTPAYLFVTATDFAGNESQPADLDAVSDVPDGAALRFGLHGNHPNPFNPQTIIAFELARPGPTRLVVHDVGGARIRTLVQESLDAGRHEITWDGKTDAGRDAASGVYLYRLESSGAVQTERMTLVR